MVFCTTPPMTVPREKEPHRWSVEHQGTWKLEGILLAGCCISAHLPGERLRPETVRGAFRDPQDDLALPPPPGASSAGYVCGMSYMNHA